MLISGSHWLDGCHTDHQGHQIIHPAIRLSQTVCHTDTDYKILIVVPLIDIFNSVSVCSDDIVKIYSFWNNTPTEHMISIDIVENS